MKKTTYKDLALYLGVSESAVKQYNKKKRGLMLIGLTVKKHRLNLKEALENEVFHRELELPKGQNHALL